MSAKQRTLFDPEKAAGPRKSPAVGSFNSSESLTVSALISRIKNALAEAFPTAVTVAGEISNLSTPASGHIYFSLKDSNSSIGAAMWKARADKLKFRPADGMEVVVRGKIDIFDTQGKLQLYVERITPAGAGALDLAFRQLKEKLEKEGLFDPNRKKSIPQFPRAIALVTSETGAAVHDIQRTLRRRWPGAKIFLYPSMVQGDGAAQEMARNISLLDANAPQLEIDTIIIARGGGSLEDLWAFNEEVLARAISAANTPIIAGVGHEVDVTICDLVADVRAPTPTAAAELATSDSLEIRRTINALASRLDQRLREKLARSFTAVEAVERSIVFRDPANRLRSNIQRIDELSHRLRAGLHSRFSDSLRKLTPLTHRLAGLHPIRLLERAKSRLAALTGRLRWVLGSQSNSASDKLSALEARLTAVHPKGQLLLARQRLTAAQKQLEAMSYRSVLKRGFSVTRGPDGELRRSVSEFQPGEQIETELADGKVFSDVSDTSSD